MPSPNFWKLANFRQIHNYLSVGDADEIARLAANLSPMRARFDALSLVEKAIAIQAEVSEKLRIKRLQILDPMSFATLETLAKKLGVTKSALECDPMLFYDPIKGPVAFALAALGKVDFPNNNHSLFDVVPLATESILDKYDKLTKLNRPEFPCSLEELLRYVTNDATTPCGALNAAFKGFLQISSPPRPSEEFREMLKTETNARDSYLAELNKYPEAELRPGYLSELMGSSEELISWFSEVLDYRNTFSPIRICPDSVASEAAEIYEEVQNNLNQTEQWLLLHLDEFDFYTFWQKHRKAYLADNAAKVKARKMASETNRISGRQGASEAGSSIWRNRTREFITFCGDREVPAAGEKREEFFQEFAARLSSDTRTRAKIRGFFSTLWIQLEDDETKTTLENIADLLEEEKIKNATVSTIEVCLKELRILKERRGRPHSLIGEGAKSATPAKEKRV